MYPFNKQAEIDRKAQADAMDNRSTELVREEEYLMNELKKMELAQKKAAEKKNKPPKKVAPPPAPPVATEPAQPMTPPAPKARRLSVTASGGGETPGSPRGEDEETYVYENGTPGGRKRVPAGYELS
jgi:hypothetical protein